MSVAQGPLLLADISGYSRYLGGVELDHSRDVLADLLETVSEQLSEVLDVAKLEGDAVFCAGGDERADAAGILTALDGCYFAFARRRLTISAATSCRCDACRRIPDLDLKFLVHHGSFAEHDVAGRSELVGPDVVLVHRMLKNSVTAATGIEAYAYLTESLVQALGIDLDSALAHTERYEEVGEVRGVVIDMSERWRAERERVEVVVREADADFSFAGEVPVSAAEAWRAMTDPRLQLRWRVGADRVDMENPDGGRGTGSVTHCVHGKTVIDQEIVDWKPHRYYSYRERNPAGLCLWTVSFEPLDRDGPATRIRWRVQLIGGAGQRLFMLVGRRRMQRVLDEEFAGLMDHLGGALTSAPR